MLRSLGAAASALALTLVLASAASAQQAPSLDVHGTIAAIDANVMTVKGPAGISQIALPENVRVAYYVKTDLSKIGPGTFIGVAAVRRPDGTYRALGIQLFDQQNHPAESDRPWHYSAESTMTNATIASITESTVDRVDGRMLLLKWKDGEKQVFVPPSAPVVTPAPADRSALVVGASVLVFAVQGSNGALSARAVQVGKDGFVIPF